MPTADETFKHSDPTRVLSEVTERLASANSLSRVTHLVAAAARALSGADGATFVLRDGERCHYADEVAISPLWKGQRFPLEACISGWSMLHREVVVIRDIYADGRIPHDAYRPTFVKSLCMIPIRAEKPVGAIGNYWSREYEPSPEEIRLLQLLANAATIALENLELRNLDPTRASPRERELETTLQSLAHDLRAPIATMTGLAELLLEEIGAKVDAETRGYLQAIVATGNLACHQMERLLNLYRVARRKLELQRVDLSEIAEDVGSALRTLERGREIRFQAESGLVAEADPVLMRSVLENLLANAFKYSAKRPVAEVTFGKGGESATETTFFVRDNGCGFDPAKSGSLFKPMGRLHDDGEFAGTGLGLVSVAKIIELHGGRVRAEGKPGEGATFAFTLPKPLGQ